MSFQRPISLIFRVVTQVNQSLVLHPIDRGLRRFDRDATATELVDVRRTRTNLLGDVLGRSRQAAHVRGADSICSPV